MRLGVDADVRLLPSAPPSIPFYPAIRDLDLWNESSSRRDICALRAVPCRPGTRARSRRSAGQRRARTTARDDGDGPGEPDPPSRNHPSYGATL